MGRAGVVPSFGTTASVAMDEAGNAVAMMHSNGNSSGVVTAGLGFLYNNHMHNFNPRPGFRNSVAAGKYRGGVGRTDPRLAQRSAVSGDQPLLAGRRHCRDAGVPERGRVRDVAQEAVAQPRIHAEYARRTVLVDPGLPARR